MNPSERKNMIEILHFVTGQPEKIYERMDDERLEREYQLKVERR